MHAPSAICRQLYGEHNQLRLAWSGKDEAFALVQLYHISDIGDLDESHSYRCLWTVEPSKGEDGKTRMRHVDRGPIYNRAGGGKPDWDSNNRVPVFVATLDDSYGLSHNDVMSGKFITDVRKWMIPIERRIRESARECGAALVSRTNDVADQIADAVVYESNKPDQATVIAANKHVKGETASCINRGERAQEELADRFMPGEITA